MFNLAKIETESVKVKLSKSDQEQLCKWFLHCIGGIPKRYHLSDNIGTARWSTLATLHRLSRKGLITYDFESGQYMSRMWGVKYCNLKLTKAGEAHMRESLGIEGL